MPSSKKWYSLERRFEKECDPVEMDLYSSIRKNHVLSICGKKLRVGRLILQWMIRENLCNSSGEGGPFEEGADRKGLLVKLRNLLTIARSYNYHCADISQSIIFSVLQGDYTYATGNSHLQKECRRIEKWLKVNQKIQP